MEHRPGGPPRPRRLRHRIFRRHRDELDVFHRTLQHRRQRSRRTAARRLTRMRRHQEKRHQHQRRRSTRPAAPTRTAAAAATPQRPRTTSAKSARKCRRPFPRSPERPARPGPGGAGDAAGIPAPAILLRSTTPRIDLRRMRRDPGLLVPLLSSAGGKPQPLRAKYSPHSARARPILHPESCKPLRTSWPGPVPSPGPNLPPPAASRTSWSSGAPAMPPACWLRRTGRRYMRLDSAVEGYARLSPSIRREFLTYTLVGLAGQEERSRRPRRRTRTKHRRHLARKTRPRPRKPLHGPRRPPRRAAHPAKRRLHDCRRHHLPDGPSRAPPRKKFRPDGARLRPRHHHRRHRHASPNPCAKPSTTPSTARSTIS